METHFQGSTLKKVFSRRVIALMALLVLALFVVRPQVGLLHRKVAESLSMELGRRVEIGAVHIRFLPRPGLELENLTIDDNPEFGAEPLLRSSDVAAWLRVISLLRGRIEISSLSLSDASLNLSRNAQGKWNFEELVERASKSSTAPTTAGKREPRRKFPYIEAGHARINFKNGVEKTHFALTNADFSLWQETENQWGMRMRASPIRTDANLTDTQRYQYRRNMAALLGAVRHAHSIFAGLETGADRASFQAGFWNGSGLARQRRPFEHFGGNIERLKDHQ